MLKMLTKQPTWLTAHTGAFSLTVRLQMITAFVMRESPMFFLMRNELSLAVTGVMQDVQQTLRMITA